MLQDKHLTFVRTVAATVSVGLQTFIAIHILNLGGTSMGTILTSIGILLMLLLPGGFLAAMLVVGFKKIKAAEAVKVETKCNGECNGTCYKDD